MSTIATVRVEDWIGHIYQGDARVWLPQWPDGSVSCCVTSIPYWGLRDYDTEPLIWAGDAVCEHEWGSPERGKRKDMLPREESTSAGRTGADERQGIGPPGGGSFCLRCGAWRGDLGLEPTPELYIEHVVGVFREVRRVLRPDGVLWLNLGDSYGQGGGNQVVQTKNASHGLDGMRQKTPGVGSKQLAGMPWRVALALQADGWWLRSAIVWAKGISFCEGYSGSVMPESVTDRPTNAYEMVYLLTKSERYFYDGDAVRERALRSHSGNIERKLEVPTRMNDHRGSSVPWQNDGSGRNLRNVWAITPQPMEWEMCRVCKRVYSPAEHTRLKRLDVCQACGREYVPKQIKYLRRDGEGRRICECGCSDEWKIIVWCKCGRNDSWLSHFATFPETLIAPMIQVGCPHKICAECGAPWVREVEVERAPSIAGPKTQAKRDHGLATAFSGYADGLPSRPRRTLGFVPTCECGGETRPGIVIDPFIGSGTVALGAHKAGRRWAGSELNSDYVILAEERIRRAREQGNLDFDEGEQRLC